MDPVFMKAYKLLFSNEPDSADQLRGMLDQALKQRYGNSVSLSTVLPPTPTPTAPATPIVDIELKLATRNAADVFVHSDESEESTASPENDKDEELTLDLLQEELNCVMCKQINVGPKNLLVECLECHSLYHQECHQPPISDAETSDPRLAWYCATCKKKMDKTLATIKSTTVSSNSKSSLSTSSRGSSKKSNISISENSVSKSSTRSGKSAAGKTVTPFFTIITADQRLQQMKKKAAAGKKGHDKGKLTK